jgi:hypothetical protein
VISYGLRIKRSAFKIILNALLYVCEEDYDSDKAAPQSNIAKTTGFSGPD